MARKTAKAVVEEIRRDRPGATVDVLRNDEWVSYTDVAAHIPEADWGNWRVNEIRWFGNDSVMVTVS